MLGKGQRVRQLRQVDLSQVQRPKTLLILHYHSKRISVPLFTEVPALAQLLYHHIAKLEQTVLMNDPGWEKQSNSQIVCFQIRKDPHPDAQPPLSDGDLRSDVLLSLLRVDPDGPFVGGRAEQTLAELSLRVDVTKVYKYLEVQPFYTFPQAPRSNWPYFQFHRLLASSSVSNTYLARRLSNGHFYAVRVYAHGCRSGRQELESLEQLQGLREQETTGLLCVSHQIALIPHPETEEGEEDDVNNCRHISLVIPYFVRGSLEDWMRQARTGRGRRVTEMDCLNYLKDLMWGVHQLHRKYNLIHRAIVPAHLQLDHNHTLRLSYYASCLPFCDAVGQVLMYQQRPVMRGQTERELEEMFQEEEYDLGEFGAPQVVKGQPYNYLVDFYSVGVVIKKLHELSQAHQRGPVSQNHQNLMTTMIAKLTSPDLAERAAIVSEIIEDIERENQEGSQPAVVNPLISLQDIHVGRPIDSVTGKKFIEKEEMSNGIDHQTVIAFFRQPLIPAKPKGKRLRRQSKDKGSVKNSREKSEKSHSKKSADSKHDQQPKQRKISQDKQKTNSFNESKDKKSLQQKQSSKQSQGSPKKTIPSKDPSKKEQSKEHARKQHTSKDFMKREGTKTSHLEEERSRLMVPKSPKVSQAAKLLSPVLRNKSPTSKERLK